MGDNPQLTSLPASLCTLPKLRVLDLGGCAGLTTLPPAIIQLTQLLDVKDVKDDDEEECHYINIQGCTGLVAPPYSIIEGKEEEEDSHFPAVLAWFAGDEGGQQDGGGHPADLLALTVGEIVALPTSEFARVMHQIADMHHEASKQRGGSGL